MTFDAGFFNFTMEAVPASLEVVKYNAKKYTSLTESKSEKADFMAVCDIDMRMRLQSHLWTHSADGGEGEGWTPDMDTTMPIKVRLLVTGGKVKAYIGTTPGDKAFSGMVTGVPR